MSKQTMQAILGALSIEESRAVYNALAQWVDNERNALPEEGEQEEPGDAEAKRAVALLEGVVDKLETVIAV